MFTITNLTLTHRKDLTVLVDSLSLAVSDGERLALIGEEGNGKSTLLRVLAGDPSVSDYIDVSGSFSCRGRAGYLPQELPKDEREKSAYDFFCASPAFFDQSPKDLGQLAAQLALPADAFYSPQRMADFSGGERVKLQLARLLMAAPEALLLDEPTNDLDGDSVRWLEDFLLTCKLTVLFVSHDEALLSRAATSVLLLERLRRRQVPRATLYAIGYERFYEERGAAFDKQTRIARKERKDFQAKMERYETIRRKVERDQQNISRQNPHGGFLLKKKMHTIQAMGRRFERERDDMTVMPEQEEAIFAKLDCAPLPADKTVLDLACPALTIDGRTLCRDIRLTVRAKDKLCICGKNGVGKSTLLRLIRDTLEKRAAGSRRPARSASFARRAALPFGRKGRAKPRRAAAGQHEIHRRRDEPSMRRAFRRAKGQADVFDDGRKPGRRAAARRADAKPLPALRPGCAEFVRRLPRLHHRRVARQAVRGGRLHARRPPRARRGARSPDFGRFMTNFDRKWCGHSRFKPFLPP